MGKKVKLLKASEIQDENIFLYVKKIELVDQGALFEWSGKPSDHTEMQITGKQCRSIQPEVNVSDEKITYTFDKSLIFDIGISVAGSSSSTVPQNVSNENNECSGS